ncbi:hypothetical protein E4T49_02376 [Aureobasidium sp. EXF-10728]|nr:hypothetical protein E4T49_02376 [Aureobasidium sp. EXF-10728]
MAGFSPSSSHKCTHYFTNDRFCRTGSIHSWVLPSLPLSTRSTCEDCTKAEQHEKAEIQRLQTELKKQMEEEEKAEKEEIKKQEQARRGRSWEKEGRRVERERKEGKKGAVEALRSQLAGMKVSDGERPSSGRGKWSEDLD